MSSTVEQIKERLGIVDVVSSYMKVEKAGRNLKGRCPFHNEKTPSFFLSPERNTYYCFGCGAKGDIFSFVEEFEGIDFMGALRTLADRAGVVIERINPEVQSERERLYALLEMATRFFEKKRAEHFAAEEYIATRGITSATVGHFRIGFAPAEWRALRSHLLSNGFSDFEMEKAGVIKKSDKGGSVEERWYDVFRNRIMFPILDTAGRVIAFSGRILGADDAHNPKYLNSPETVLFKKSETLHGFDKAKFAMRKYDFALLVEGQIDLVMAHQAGFTNTIALSGTAFTEMHAHKVGNLTKRMVLALDADPAGVASASRSTALLLHNGFDVKVAALPSGKDPADAIKENTDIFKAAIKNATHIVEYMLAQLSASMSNERTFKLLVKEKVLPFVAAIENKIDQDHFVNVVASTIGTTAEAVHAELLKIPNDEVPTSKNEEKKHNTEIVARRDIIARKIAGLILWQKKLSDAERSIEPLNAEARFIELLETPITAISDDGNIRIFEAEVTFGGSSRVAETLEEMFRYLEEEVLRGRLALLMRNLKAAEALKNVENAKTILKECQAISERMQGLRSGVVTTGASRGSP